MFFTVDLNCKHPQIRDLLAVDLLGIFGDKLCMQDDFPLGNFVWKMLQQKDRKNAN